MLCGATVFCRLVCVIFVGGSTICVHLNRGVEFDVIGIGGFPLERDAGDWQRVRHLDLDSAQASLRFQDRIPFYHRDRLDSGMYLGGHYGLLEPASNR